MVVQRAIACAALKLDCRAGHPRRRCVVQANGQRTRNNHRKHRDESHLASPETGSHAGPDLSFHATDLTDILYQRDREFIAFARPDLAVSGSFVVPEIYIRALSVA